MRRVNMLTLIIVFVAIPVINEAALKPLPDEETLRVSLSRCVLEAGKRFFPENEVITYSLPLTETDKNKPSAVVLNTVLLSNFAAEHRWSILVANVSNDAVYINSSPTKTMSYIIQIRSRDEFVKNLKILKSFMSWNPHARFLVMSVTIFNNILGVATEVIKSLWEEKVIRGIVLLPNPKTNTIFDVYTWYPYEKGNCGDNFTFVKIIDTCSFGKTTRNISWFKGKVPKQVNNCTLRVRYVDWPPYIIEVENNTHVSHFSSFSNHGIEIELVQMIASILNFSVEYIKSDALNGWGRVFRNGSATGNLLELRNDKADIAIGGYTLTYERFLFLDVANPYLYTELTWCVPHIPMVKYKALTLNIDISIILLVCFILIFLPIWYLGRDCEPSTYRNPTSALQNTWAVVIGVPASKLPNTLWVRYFTALLLFLSFNILSAYQTYLTCMLTDNNYKEEITSIEDIFNGKLKMYFYANSAMYFKEGTPINSKIRANWNECQNISVCLYNVAFKADSAVFLSKHYLKYVFNNYRDDRMEPLLYKMNGFRVQGPIAMIMRKGFPFYDYINEITEMLAAAGFIFKWDKDIWAADNNHYRTRYQEDADTLNFGNMKPIFFFIVSGHTMCLVVFIIEWIVSKFANYNLHKN